MRKPLSVSSLPVIDCHLSGKSMKIIVLALCLLPLFACAKHAPALSPPVAAEVPILPEFAELNALHGQFQGFRDDPLFLRYGFGFNFPYADWLQQVRNLERTPVMAEGARALAGLAVAYRSHGADSEVSKQFETRFAQILRTPATDKPPAVTMPVSDPVNATRTQVSILFTGDTQGVVYPQPGIFGPVGGLARRLPVIERVRAEDPGVLLVDAGDAFASGFARAGKINTILVRAMNSMPYDAMGLGTYDLEMGEVALRELVGMAKFPFICTNLVFQNGADPWIKPYVLIKRDQLRIAFISLLPPVTGMRVTGARFVPPRQALLALLPELKVKADCIVLLTQYGSADIAELLGTDHAVDVIIGDGKSASRDDPLYLPAVPKALGFGFARLERSGAEAFHALETMPILMGAAEDAQLLKIMDELKE